VLCPDVIVIQIACLFHRVFDDFLGTRRLRQLAHRDHVRSRLNNLFDFESNFAQIDFEVLEDVGRHSRTLFDEAKQNVLGPNIFVIETLGFLVGQLHDLPCPVRKPFVHQ